MNVKAFCQLQKANNHQPVFSRLYVISPNTRAHLSKPQALSRTGGALSLLPSSLVPFPSGLAASPQLAPTPSQLEAQPGK